MPRTSALLISSFAFWLMVGIAIAVLDTIGSASLDALDTPQTGISLAGLIGSLIGLFISVPLLVTKGLLLVGLLKINVPAGDAAWMAFNVMFDVSFCVVCGICLQSLLVPFYLLWRDEPRRSK